MKQTHRGKRGGRILLTPGSLMRLIVKLLKLGTEQNQALIEEERNFMARLSAISECGQSRLKVRKNRRVTLHYRVTLSSGEEFDSSGPNSPLEIVCGRGETIQGLEKRILGMSSGEQKEFVVPPEEAFGPRDETLMKKIPTAELPMDVSPKLGNRVPFRDKGTRLIGRIVDVRNSAVVADFNHPLAGKPLHYEVRILQVAEAIPEQLAS